MREPFIRLQCGIKRDTFFSGRIEKMFTNIVDLPPRRIEHMQVGLDKYEMNYFLLLLLFQPLSTLQVVMCFTHPVLPAYGFSAVDSSLRRLPTEHFVKSGLQYSVPISLIVQYHLEVDIFSTMTVSFVCRRISLFLMQFQKLIYIMDLSIALWLTRNLSTLRTVIISKQYDR